MQISDMLDLVLRTLDEGKANDITNIDVRGKTSIMDYLVVASGTSERHVKALARQVTEKLGEHRIKPLGIEGEQKGDWVLVDIGDIVLHVMVPKTRGFYQLEKLWDADFDTEQNSA
ncbi:MAG: ribosome silencing factor [Methylococcus sp.]|nr:MAG: ribosome silencing factor [Methylococcus sp.]